MFVDTVRRDYHRLQHAFEEMESIQQWDDRALFAVAEKVSLWSPAQELLHIGLVIGSIVPRIEMLYEDTSAEIVRTGGPNGPGWAVLLTGRIPRGKAKAPPGMEPSAGVSREEVRAALAKSRGQLESLAAKIPDLRKFRGRLPHLRLGNLNSIQWLRFLRIHTDHHLRVTREIHAALERR